MLLVTSLKHSKSKLNLRRSQVFNAQFSLTSVFASRITTVQRRHSGQGVSGDSKRHRQQHHHRRPRSPSNRPPPLCTHPMLPSWLSSDSTSSLPMQSLLWVFFLSFVCKCLCGSFKLFWCMDLWRSWQHCMPVWVYQFYFLGFLYGWWIFFSVERGGKFVLQVSVSVFMVRFKNRGNKEEKQTS